MKRTPARSAFALTVTLVLMVLIIVIVVAYLVSTRIERSTSSVYANRLRAKIQADSGLSAAIHVIRDNTRYGNYITAMPATSPAPTSHYTEVYRPTDPATRAVVPDEFLQLSNAGGEVLVSSASSTTSAGPDPRPTPQAIPPAGPFALNSPTFTPSNSYDFNQIVRMGGNNSARLVDPDGLPAYGQWVNVRDSAGNLIGRYAFFIQDESMKVNVDVAGNNVGGTNARPNDLVSPTPAGPTSQREETDPAAILATTANRTLADQKLTATGTPGARVSTPSTIALLDEWKNNFPNYAHIATALSKDDNTTARGWQRLDLNALVAGSSNKSAVAHQISDWIKDTWTGPTTIPNLQSYQIFGDERRRLQLAANIIDYIDTDKVPSEVLDSGTPYDPPIIGIEKIPYVTEVDAIYTSTVISPGTATVTLKFRFKFQNLFDQDLALEQMIRKIRIKGAPAVIKNSPTPVFDPSNQWFEFNVPSGQLTGTIPWGPDQDGRAGAKTFRTEVVLSQTVTYTPGGSVSRFENGLIELEILGASGERLDITKMALNDREAKYQDLTPALTYDFLEQSRQAASINVTYELAPPSTTIQFGDPRYRPSLETRRWYNISRTDEARVDTFVDQAEQNSRTFAVDWYDYFGDRPFLFHRDGPMLSPGELGNVSVCEYPWRTLYLQQPERPVNTTQVGPMTDVPLRRSNSVDYVLLDLFRTDSAISRRAGININSQQKFGTQQNALDTLFYLVPVGAQTLAQAAIDKVTNNTTSGLLSCLLDRRIAVGPPPDNNPRRPFFQIGELAAMMGRLMSLSDGTSASSRSVVTYSVVTNTNYRRDTQVEQAFRKVSNSITTRGNVFRVLYVGQAIKDFDLSGTVNRPEKIQAEYLGEAFVERETIFGSPTGVGSSSVTKTTDSRYKTIANRVVTE